MAEAAPRRMQYMATTMTHGGGPLGLSLQARRQKHENDIAWCRVEVLVAPVALGCHPGGDTGVVLGYLVKADHLCHLALRGDQLLLDG
jgi:hypothetical protein